MTKKVSDNKAKDLSYYLTLFKLEGHTTWRAHLGGHKEAFNEDVSSWGKKGPKVTESQVLRIDRLTGGFISL